MEYSAPSARYYQRFCVYGRSPQNLIASVALRSPLTLEPVVGPCEVVLDEVWTHRKHRGQGYATALLKLALDVAAGKGWAVLCRPHPHDSPGTYAELAAWYLKRGFETRPLRAEGWLIAYPF